MRPEAVTPPPQKEWCPANMAAVFGLFMGSVAICNVSSLQVLRWFFASSLLELCVAREVWSHLDMSKTVPNILALWGGSMWHHLPFLFASWAPLGRFLVPFWAELDPKGGPKIMFLGIMLEK